MCGQWLPRGIDYGQSRGVQRGDEKESSFQVLLVIESLLMSAGKNDGIRTLQGLGFGLSYGMGS